MQDTLPNESLDFRQCVKLPNPLPRESWGLVIVIFSNTTGSITILSSQEYGAGKGIALCFFVFPED